MKKNVAIIDTGFSGFNERIIGQLTIKKSNGIIVESNECYDKLNHGTIVTNIFIKKTKDVNFHVINIFDNEYSEVDLLIYALKKCLYEIKPFLIHMSIGFDFSKRNEDLHQIIKKLHQNNVILVASYNNNGSICYPAYFDEVIGVDCGIANGKLNDYIFCCDKKINIIMNNVVQRIQRNDHEYDIVNGCSFVSPYISILIINKFYECTNYSLHDVLNYLEICSFQSIKTKNNNKLQVKNYNKKKAIVFPMNKEINTLVMNSSLLDIEILDIYDFPHLGHIGDHIDNYIVKNIFNIERDDFDLIIVGHLNIIEKYIKKKDIFKVLFKFANTKEFYSFSDLSHYGIRFKNIFYPTISSENVPYYNMNKLHKFNYPVVAIAGTSSKQGKFTLQLKLINHFKKDGYNVLALITEPSGYSINNSIVIPLGYDSNVNLHNEEIISIINEEIYNKTDKDTDILITGLQSQSIPLKLDNLQDIPKYNDSIIYGTNPDFYILCVNIYDDIEVIKRHICYLEGINNSKVLCLAVFPFQRADINIGNNYIEEPSNLIDEYIKYINDFFSLPVFCLNKNEQIIQLYDYLVSNLTGGRL